MTRFRSLILATVLASTLPGCYGSFGAFHKVHDWNGSATGNKVGDSAIHFLFWIVPVYPVLLLGDLIIFNTIEFATGDQVFK